MRMSGHVSTEITSEQELYRIVKAIERCNGLGTQAGNFSF